MDNPDLHLYAVLARTRDGCYRPRGARRSAVHLVSRGNLSAAFSVFPAAAEGPSGPEYRGVMRRLLRHSAVLPAPRRTILPSHEALLQLLSCQQNYMLEQLRRFSGLIEVRLRAVRRIKEGAPPRGAATALDDERSYLLARFCTALCCGGFTVKPLPLRHDRELLRLGCLLPQSALPLFSSTCDALRSRHGSICELALTPPLAPVDFVDSRLFH